MSHQVIIINTVSPVSGSALTSNEEPACKVSVEFRPEHGLTPAQVGDQVSRIVKKCNQIIDGAD